MNKVLFILLSWSVLAFGMQPSAQQLRKNIKLRNVSEYEVGVKQLTTTGHTVLNDHLLKKWQTVDVTLMPEQRCKLQFYYYSRRLAQTYLYDCVFTYDAFTDTNFVVSIFEEAEDTDPDFYDYIMRLVLIPAFPTPENKHSKLQQKCQPTIVRDPDPEEEEFRLPSSIVAYPYSDDEEDNQPQPNDRALMPPPPPRPPRNSSSRR